VVGSDSIGPRIGNGAYSEYLWYRSGPSCPCNRSGDLIAELCMLVEQEDSKHSQ